MKLLRRYVPPPLGQAGQRLLFLLLVALCTLNIADFGLTRYAMWLGFATESNEIMDFFFRQSDVAAAAFKFGVVTGGAAALWLLRRFRASLVAGVLLAFLFAAVVTYQGLWIFSL
jgi:Domain of unknown function (DUF5658)